MNSNSSHKFHSNSTPPMSKIETADLQDWDTPFTLEELESIDAAIEEAAAAATSASTPASSSFGLKTPRTSSKDDLDRPNTRRRLPDSFVSSNRQTGLGRNTGYFGLTPCRTNWAFPQASVKLRYQPMKFGGRIVYCRTAEEVEEATMQILKLLDSKKRELGRAVLGVDLEWKPSFSQGVLQGKAAVIQICGDMTHCYVLHIFHSGIPYTLQSLLEDPTSVKVGVGIDNDAVKLFHDHNVSIKSVEDLSILANQKLGGMPKQWSLSSLVELFICKQLPKPKKIRLGNWEDSVLSKPQLEYAATDAFASWYLYEVLNSFPDLSESKNEN